MARGYKDTSIKRKKIICTNHKESQETDVSPKKKIVVKSNLEETDNENGYFLINGPVYLRKSLIDLDKSLLQTSQKNSDVECYLNEELVTENTLITTNNEVENEECIDELERWRNCCQKGIFSLKELLLVCEKNPSSILNACSKFRTKGNNLLSLEEQMENKEEPVSQIKLTHGEIFGDAKYHFLMIDAGTSTSTVPVKSINTQFNKMDRRVKKFKKRQKVKKVENVKEEPILPMVNKTVRASIVSEAPTVLQIGIELKKQQMNFFEPPVKPSITSFRKFDETERFEGSELLKPHSSVVNFSINTPLYTYGLNENREQEKKPIEVAKSINPGEYIKGSSSQNLDVKNQYLKLKGIIQEEKRRSQMHRVSIQDQIVSEEISSNQSSQNKFAKILGGFLRRGSNKLNNGKGNVKRTSQDTTEPSETNDDDKDINDDSSASTSDDSSRKVARHSAHSAYKLRANPVERPVDEHENQINKYLNNV